MKLYICVSLIQKNSRDLHPVTEMCESKREFTDKGHF